MKVAILCGGLGMRMREETEYRPKPMVEIGRWPMLWHIIKIYAHYGFNEFILCLGYRGNMIKEYFLNYEAMNNDFTIQLGSSNKVTYHGAHGEQDYSITLVDTGQETMTGGRIRRIAPYLDADTFMVTYGDGVSNVNLKELLAFHKSHGKKATVTAVRPTSRYGMLEVDGKGQVASFMEKPVLDGWISAGFMVFHRDVLDLLDGDECVLERSPMEQLARRDQLVAYRHEGFFYAVDTYREFKAINEMWAGGNAPWKVWQ
jgi:glucose-1-phosphate cytidylyltransferase